MEDRGIRGGSVEGGVESIMLNVIALKRQDRCI